MTRLNERGYRTASRPKPKLEESLWTIDGWQAGQSVSVSIKLPITQPHLDVLAT